MIALQEFVKCLPSSEELIESASIGRRSLSNVVMESDAALSALPLHFQSVLAPVKVCRDMITCLRLHVFVMCYTADVLTCVHGLVRVRLSDSTSCIQCSRADVPYSHLFLVQNSKKYCMFCRTLRQCRTR